MFQNYSLPMMVQEQNPKLYQAKYQVPSRSIFESPNHVRSSSVISDFKQFQLHSSLHVGTPHKTILIQFLTIYISYQRSGNGQCCGLTGYIGQAGLVRCVNLEESGFHHCLRTLQNLVLFVANMELLIIGLPTNVDIIYLGDYLSYTSFNHSSHYSYKFLLRPLTKRFSHFHFASSLKDGIFIVQWVMQF